MRMKMTLTRKAVAEMFGVTTATVSDWVAKGLLVSVPNVGKRMSITAASADSLLEKFADIGQVENNVIACESEIRKKESSLKEQLTDLENRISFVTNWDLFQTLFIHAFEILSKNNMSEQTQEMVSMYLKGHSAQEIGEQYQINPNRVRKIVSGGIYRLNRADSYKELMEENRMLRKRIGYMEQDLPVKIASIPLLQKSVRELGLSVRCVNSLNAYDVKTLGELAGLKENEYHKMRNLGAKSVREIQEKLKEFGLFMGMKDDEIDDWWFWYSTE